jgi:hypothetical protein
MFIKNKKTSAIKTFTNPSNNFAKYNSPIKTKKLKEITAYSLSKESRQVVNKNPYKNIFKNVFVSFFLLLY